MERIINYIVYLSDSLDLDNDEKTCYCVDVRRIGFVELKMLDFHYL